MTYAYDDGFHLLFSFPPPVGRGKASHVVNEPNPGTLVWFDRIPAFPQPLESFLHDRHHSARHYHRVQLNITSNPISHPFFFPPRFPALS